MTTKTALSLAFALALTSIACGKGADSDGASPRKSAAAKEAAREGGGAAPAGRSWKYPSAQAIVSKAETPEARALLSQAEFSSQGLKAMFATEGKMTSTEYEALVLARGKCLVSQSTGRLHACPVGKSQDLRALQEGRSMDSAARVAVLERLMGHDDPKVRSAAVEEMLVHAASLPQEDGKAKVEAVVARMKGEADASVIKSALEHAGTARQVRSFRDWQVSLMGSPSDEIRMAAISGDDLLPQMAEDEVPAYRSALVARLEDRNLIAQRACEKLGAAALPSHIPLLSSKLAAGKDRLVPAGCFRGLVAMWSQRGGDDMAPALEATLNYLRHTPRSHALPAYQAIGALPGRDALERVKARAPYYDEQGMAAALKDVALDTAVDSLVAAEAIAKLGEMGAKDALAALSHRVRQADNPHLTQAYDEAVKAAEKP